MRAHRRLAALRQLTTPALGSAPPLAPGLRRHRVLEPIPFSEGRVLLDAAAQAQLQDQAMVLLWFATAGEIEVLGHAWAEGDEAACRELSQRRADVVRDALVALGVPGWALRARGCGTEQPAKGLDGGASRRVELWLCQRGLELPPVPCDDPGGEGCCRHC